jgi:hypothetical protein
LNSQGYKCGYNDQAENLQEGVTSLNPTGRPWISPVKKPDDARDEWSMLLDPTIHAIGYSAESRDSLVKPEWKLSMADREKLEYRLGSAVDAAI